MRCICFVFLPAYSNDLLLISVSSPFKITKYCILYIKMLIKKTKKDYPTTCNNLDNPFFLQGSVPC